MAQVLDTLESARAAAAENAWRTAFSLYGELHERTLAPADLEVYAEAAWWSGKLDTAIGLRERAHAAYSAADDELGAARMAIALAWDYEGRGSFAVSSGWLANAERLLADLPESAEHARLTITHALTAMLAEGDYEKAEALFDEATEIGRRVGDRDTQILALSGKGRTRINQGRVEEGLAILDEATAAAVAGGARPHAMGIVYCITISSCRDLGDYRRAAEWTEAANRWCDKLDVTGFPGSCRIHRAEVMRLRGDWPAAEAQAQAACEELADFDRFISASGHYEIGEIRRQRGDFADAQESYRTSDELGRDPQPGLALLRLATGKVEAAAAAIRRAYREAGDPINVPRPTGRRLRRDHPR